MRNGARGFILLALVAAIAGVACWLTARYLNQMDYSGKNDAHVWIHTQLGITEEQDRRLTPIEKRYAEEKKHYSEMLRLANVELGKAILEDRTDSARVRAAVGQIHEAQGELQNATLQHIFEMKSVLTPEQYEKLIQSTANALGTAEHGR